MHISGNFAIEGECGTCSNFILIGVSCGVCQANNYKDCMCCDKCNCDKYEQGKPQMD